MDFKKYKIKDIGEVVGGATPLTKDSDNYDGDISWITPNDLSNYKDVYINRGERNITAKGLKEIGNKLLPKGTVLFSSRAPIGYVAIANQELCTNQGFKSVIPNYELVTSEYLYYTLGFYKSFIEKQGSGTTFMEVSGATMENIELPIPALEEQRRISDTLIKIDKKIALNKRMNAELEAMAKQLYDYWFVQFDFPDENGNPYKSSGGKMVYNSTLKREIPAGWNASNICIVSQILSGGTPSKAVKQYWENGNIPFFGPTDYEGYVFQMRTADHITERGLNNCASSLFEEGDIIITARGSIGKLVIVGVPMAMNQSCYALRPKNNQYEYLFFLTKQLIEYLKIKGNGSVFKSIIASDIEDSIMCIATDNVIYAYCEKVSPLFLLMKKNTEEIINLTHLRDSLLPMLMNGQVTVE